MNPNRAKLVLRLPNELGESPVWCNEADSLYWVDVARPGLLCQWHVSTHVKSSWLFDEALTNVTLAGAGRLLIASERRLFLFDPQTSVREYCRTMLTLQRSLRFNDGACDSKGRLWIGTMANNLARTEPSAPSGKTGDIWCVTKDGTVRVFKEKLGCPNALAWSPDGLSFYFADSSDGCIYTSIFDVEAGIFSQRRPFFSAPTMGLPDGAAVDVEGYLWNARWGGGCVIRIAPDGTLDRVVDVPTAFVTSCVFGDADRRTLYITSAINGDHNPNGGGVFAFRSPTAGLPPTVFGQAIPKLNSRRSS
ncbi:MAG: SMP-30/gluconolactonase/LRE family protein [Rhodocyclaceae bacterium]|nr:MAG: SMP-30/gluconolactonase/LRE family protein [Rhodocyclaceae bacterium]